MAVLSVTISHYFGIFWFDSSLSKYVNALPYKVDIDVPKIVEAINHIQIPNFFWSPFGVNIFFLISGFVIPISLEKYSRSEFFKKRFFRLYPTYFIGFLVTIIMLVLSSLYFNNPFPYSLNEVIFHSIIGLRDIFESSHIDMIIWTLETELKFYILCILFLPLFKKRSLIIFIIPLAIFIISYIIVIVYSWQTYYPIPSLIYMFIGTVFYFHLKQAISTLSSLIIVLILFFLYSFLFYSLSVNIIGYIYVKSISISAFYALAIFTVSYIFNNKFIFNKYIAFISKISYPFYVIHSITGYVIMIILIKNNFDPLFSMLLALTFVTILAYIIHIYVEKPSIKLGNNLSKIL